MDKISIIDEKADAPGQSRLICVGMCIVREIDIIIISTCGSKPLSSKT